ncbi:MAG: hypothetical protein K0R54_1182 [Clostridiaceae bacterium]|jgi:hypothetical protein|nr:hypothetical protein [Clostridiaceae bacterium]
MDNLKDELINTISELNLQEDIQLNDIPNLDLYMDQVITLFENGLNGSKRSEEDKILTKTMINNYSKDKILIPTKNKKYSKNHIIMMILIYNLKQSLSINDIKILMNKIVKSFDKDKEESIELDKLYENFLFIKKCNTDKFQEELEKKLNFIDEKSNFIYGDQDEYEKLLLTVLSLINSANTQRRLAEKIIDKYFK